MKVALYCSFCFLLLFSLFDDTLAKFGGVRGGMGRGRGWSGARGGGSKMKSSMRRGVRGSSSYSGGVRTGAYGYKVQSETSSLSNFGSSSFRSQHLYHNPHNPNFQSRPGFPFVILYATRPMLYDNRNYYWSYSLAQSTSDTSYPGVVCEYVFGEDDGELQNVTFTNGTQVKSIYFGCSGTVDCCGMYCCHDVNQWFELLLVIGVVGVVMFITYRRKTKRREQEHPSVDTEPLRTVRSGGKPRK